jgi:hypothetical protein
MVPIRPLQLCADGGYQLRLGVLGVPLIMVPDKTRHHVHSISMEAAMQTILVEMAHMEFCLTAALAGSGGEQASTSSSFASLFGSFESESAPPPVLYDCYDEPNDDEIVEVLALLEYNEGTSSATILVDYTTTSKSPTKCSTMEFSDADSSARTRAVAYDEPSFHCFIPPPFRAGETNEEEDSSAEEAMSAMGAAASPSPFLITVGNLLLPYLALPPTHAAVVDEPYRDAKAARALAETDKAKGCATMEAAAVVQKLAEPVVPLHLTMELVQRGPVDIEANNYSVLDDVAPSLAPSILQLAVHAEEEQVLVTTPTKCSTMDLNRGAYSVPNLPVVCIVGGPNSNEYGTNRVLHHTIGIPRGGSGPRATWAVARGAAQKSSYIYMFFSAKKYNPKYILDSNIYIYIYICFSAKKSNPKYYVDSGATASLQSSIALHVFRLHGSGKGTRQQLSRRPGRL